MTWKYRYRKQIIIGCIIFIILVSSIVLLYVNRPMKGTKKDKNEIKKVDSILEKKNEPIIEEKYKIDIKGEIIYPGIYSLDKNSRVMDVITLAGGLTEQADTSVINLSKKIKDEMVIIIYSKEEVNDFKKTKEIEEQVQEKCIQKDTESLQNDACIVEEEKPSGKVSINNATKEEFMTLPGIGESKAKDIIDYREKNGPFTSIEDLTKISGIGESIFAKIKEDITL